MKRVGRGGLGLAVAVVLGGTLLGGCASQAPVDKVGLYYTGGPIQGTHFKKLIKPGSGNAFLGFQDKVKWLPSGQRNYIVSKNANEGDRKGQDFIQVPALGGVLMDFEVSVYFKLNTSCHDPKDPNDCVVRKFWEQIGNKYDADTTGGWDKMLDQNFRKQIESAMQEKVRQFDAGQLYANQVGAGSTAKNASDILLDVQGQIASTLTDRINQVLGGPFFCSPSFDRNPPANAEPKCEAMQFLINSAVPNDPNTVGSFEAIRRSQNDVLTAQNNAQKAKAEAEGTQAAQNALTNLSPAYIELLKAQAMKDCADKQGCQLVVVQGTGAGVNVNAGGK
jgi:hypothetical protein